MATLSIPESKITVIERGRDPARLGVLTNERRAKSRADLGLAADAEVILNVGRQEFQKGQKHLLEAFGLLASARPRAVLCIAGRNGNATPELESVIARLQLGDRVRFLGHRDDVPDVLAAADVFVLSSLWEGLGGVVLEAMGLGLPIVSADLPPVREVVHGGEAALLVPAADAPALAAAVTKLLDDPAGAARLAARGKAIFDHEFTLQRATNRMIDLWRRAASGAFSGNRAAGRS